MSFFKKIKDKFSDKFPDKNSEKKPDTLVFGQDESPPSIDSAISESQENKEEIAEIINTNTESEINPESKPALEPSVELISEVILESEKKSETIPEIVSDIKVQIDDILEAPEKKSFFKKIVSVVEKTTEAVKTSLGIEKIVEGLTKTRQNFSNNLRRVLGAGRKIDSALIDEIEELLITSDIGVDTTEEIIKALKTRVSRENYEKAEDLYVILKEEIQNLLVASPSATNDALYEINSANRPFIILVIGVNGVGKTTTIGKLAYNYNNNNKNVIIGAADTFRAAANEQLEIWAERAGVDIVQQQLGADPAAVAYDTLKSAQAKNKDVVIIDTAGRLHNKTHLMAELDKITRVLKKLKSTGPDEVYLVLDATTGQNAIFQAKEFAKVSPVTGIIQTKLDGTAKGGVVLPIANELKIPVRYIGVGEKIDDLQVFSPQVFVEALFENESEKNVEEKDENS